MNSLIFKIAKYLLAIHLIIFGANKFLGFIAIAPPSGEMAQTFLSAMFQSYLGQLVGITEILGGLLLIIPKTSFIGLLVLIPVISNIVYFHLAHDMPGNGIWIFSLVLTLIVSLEYRNKFSNLLVSPSK